MRDVDINIISTVTTDEDTDKIELFTGGSFDRSGSGYVLRYEEGEGIGFEDCSVTITTGNNMVTIERSGAVSSVFTLEKEVKHHCMYNTPYGEFTLGINTFEIKSDLDENGGKLYFKYSIDINSDFISENEMEITVK